MFEATRLICVVRIWLKIKEIGKGRDSVAHHFAHLRVIQVRLIARGSDFALHGNFTEIKIELRDQ